MIKCCIHVLPIVFFIVCFCMIYLCWFVYSCCDFSVVPCPINNTTFINISSVLLISQIISECVSECLLFSTTIQQFFSYIMGRTIRVITKLPNSEQSSKGMMMRTALFYTNTLRWIFIVLVIWKKKQSVERYVAPLGNIILIPSKPVFALSP